MQTTNANNNKIPAIPSARIPKSAEQTTAAAAVSSSKLEPEVETTKAAKKAPAAQGPVPGLALEGWGLASYDSSDSDDEHQGGAVARAKPSSSSAAAAAKKGAASKSKQKGRAPSKEKYLLKKPPKPTAEAVEEDDDPLFMPGSAADGFGIGGGGGLLAPFDPFADADFGGGTGKGGGGGGGGSAAAGKEDVVHLRVQQRNGKKTLTTVQGLSAAYNYARILRDLKRELCCSGVVVEDEDLGSVIQLQGDHRKAVAAFLVKAGMATKPNVKVHGF